MRTCACGCSEPVDGRRSDARYATDACRTRAWKQRTGYADQRRRKASRNGKSRRSDVRISYPKLLAALEDDYTALGHEMPYTHARGVLRALLTDRQREILHG